MGNERLKNVISQNAEMHALGSVCRQGMFNKAYEELVPVYSEQISGLIKRLESGTKTTKKRARPLSNRQRERRQDKLLHFLELREEVTLFISSSEKDGNL